MSNKTSNARITYEFTDFDSDELNFADVAGDYEQRSCG